MTLTVKKSRPVKVGNTDYRYQVSTTKIDEDYNFSLNVTVQKWNPPEGIFQVSGLVARDYWLDISDGTKWNIGDYPVLLPQHLSRLIEFAISKGWSKTAKGKVFVLKTSNDAVFGQS